MDLYRDIIHRLRSNHSVWAIHKDTGTHRIVIRNVKRQSEEHGWLNPATTIPDNAMLQTVFLKEQKRKQVSHTHPHSFFEQIKEWHLQGHSPTVIYQLLTKRCKTSLRSVQRFIQENFPKPLDPIMHRGSVPGEIADKEEWKMT